MGRQCPVPVANDANGDIDEPNPILLLGSPESRPFRRIHPNCPQSVRGCDDTTRYSSTVSPQLRFQFFRSITYAPTGLVRGLGAGRSVGGDRVGRVLAAGLGSLVNGTVLEGAGVSGATGLDLEADALVLTQAGGGGSSGLRHDEERCE